MRTEGFTELVCDRGGCEELPAYASADKVELTGFGHVSFIDQHGETREYDLCPECYSKWREMQMRQCDQAMAFINGGDQ